jgi:hypothetical protein
MAPASRSFLFTEASTPTASEAIWPGVVVPNATHHTLAVEPVLAQIVERFLATK